MKEFQKIIKYVAIAFGLYLAITIIGAIVGGVLAISTGIYGISLLTQQSDVERIDTENKFDQFTKMNLEISSANLVIKSEGDVYKVETYQIPESTKIENKNGELIIKDTKKFVPNQESKITIYIPAGTKLEEIELEIGAGTVNIANIQTEKAEFSFGAGNVEIANLISNEAKIECGAGQVNIANSQLMNAKLDTGVGKLVYSGQMMGNSKINCGIGEVNLQLDGGTEIYSIDVEKGIGEIKINGNKVTNKTVTGNGENRISIDGGIGNINIEMYQNGIDT